MGRNLAPSFMDEEDPREMCLTGICPQVCWLPACLFCYLLHSLECPFLWLVVASGKGAERKAGATWLITSCESTEHPSVARGLPWFCFPLFSAQPEMCHQVDSGGGH